MKTLFIPAKIKSKVNESKIKSLSRKLPKNIAMAYSIQYQEIASEIKKILSKTNKVTEIIQILGCSKPNFPKNTQAILLIGSGRFHALSLASKTKLPIYILERDNLSEISETDIESFKKRKKASYLKFLNAEQVGILVSTKPGQENLKKAINLKKKLKDKKSYLFISNNINSEEFENFGLESWINTACPRLDMDSHIINAGELNLGKSK
jgi:2-(3-amino-3-carboxypropyl)histidine synthase